MAFSWDHFAGHHDYYDFSLNDTKHYWDVDTFGVSLRKLTLRVVDVLTQGT